MSENIKTWHFSLGQGHTHRVNGMTWDCDLDRDRWHVCLGSGEDVLAGRGSVELSIREGGSGRARFFPRGVHRVE
jgi:hypothetical protein